MGTKPLTAGELGTAAMETDVLTDTDSSGASGALKSPAVEGSDGITAAGEDTAGRLKLIGEAAAGGEDTPGRPVETAGSDTLPGADTLGVWLVTGGRLGEATAGREVDTAVDGVDVLTEEEDATPRSGNCRPPIHRLSGRSAEEEEEVEPG